jgi:hypothetical protein
LALGWQDYRSDAQKTGELEVTVSARKSRLVVLRQGTTPYPTTFAEDVAARRRAVTPSDVRQTASSLNDATSLTVGLTQSLLVSSATIRGTISYTGFDGVPRSFAADVGAQARYLETSAGGSLGALRTAGRGLAVAGAGFALYDLQQGYKYGNDNQVFSGSYNLAALGVGILMPPVGIGMGLAKLADDLWPQAPSGNILDAAAMTDSSYLRP